MPRSLTEESITDSQLTAETAAPPTRKSEINLLGRSELEEKRKSTPNRWRNKVSPYIVILTALFKPTAYLDFAQGYYNHGGPAFLLFYMPLLVLIGYPMVYLQIAAGQISGKSLPNTLKNLCPIFGGLGLTLCIFAVLEMISNMTQVGLLGEGYNFTVSNVSNFSVHDDPCNPNLALTLSILTAFILSTMFVFVAIKRMEYLSFVMFSLMLLIVAGLGFVSVWDSRHPRFLEVMLSRFSFEKTLTAAFWAHLFTCLADTMDMHFIIAPMVSSHNAYKHRIVNITAVVLGSTMLFSVLAVIVVGALLSNLLEPGTSLENVLYNLHYFDHFISQAYSSHHCWGRKLVTTLMILTQTTRILVLMHVVVEAIDNLWSQKLEIAKKVVRVVVSVLLFTSVIWVAYFRSRMALANMHLAMEVGTSLCVLLIFILFGWHLKSSCLIQKVTASQGPRFIPLCLPNFVKYLCPLFLFLSIVLSSSVANDNYPLPTNLMTDATSAVLIIFPFLVTLIYGGIIIRRLWGADMGQNLFQPKAEWGPLPVSEVRRILLYESLERERLAPVADGNYEQVGTVRKVYGKGRQSWNKPKPASRKPSWIKSSGRN